MTEHEIDIQNEVSNELLHPKQYEVILLNDDYTSMEFVVFVLKEIFFKSEDEAVNITVSIHNNGRGRCGIYTLDIAKSKVKNTIDIARENEFPLKAIYEEVK